MPGPMPAILEGVVTDIAARRRFPESTYRLQFHAGFTFRDAYQIVSYLHDLGAAVWPDTTPRMPGLNPRQTWSHGFTGERVHVAMEDDQPMLAVADLMAQFPVALLVAQSAERV